MTESKIDQPETGNPTPTRRNGNVRPIDIFLPEIKLCLEQKDYLELKALLIEINPIDLADGFDHLTPAQQSLVFRLLSPPRMVDVFQELDPTQQEHIVQGLSDQTLGPLFEGIPDDVSADIIQKLPERVVKKMMSLMKKEKLRKVTDILNYPPQTVGAVMTTDIVTSPPDVTAKTALSTLQAQCRVRHPGKIDSLYVTESNGRLIGLLPLEILVAAPPEMRIRDLMSPSSAIRLRADMDQEEAARLIAKYKIISAPVINKDGILIGALMADDVLKVIEEESTEDFHKLGSVGVLNLSLREAPALLLYRKRAGWLVLLVFMNIFGGAALAFFETTISAVVALVFFLPLIVGSGGNAGSQSATLMIRALATGDVHTKDWLALWAKEVGVAALLGLTMGLAVWSLGLWRGGPQVGTVVALSMTIVVIMGSMIGMILPVILSRLKMDPATASAPLVTSITDIVGICIYFSIATLLLIK